MATQKRKLDETRKQPLTLDALREYGEFDDFPPPGSFDPEGEWKNVYRIWLVTRRSNGFLSIERAPASDSSPVTLNVETCVLQAAKVIHRTRARLQCANDSLSTPQSWDVKSEILDPDFQRVEVADSWETGRVRDGKLIVNADWGGLGGGGTRERHHKLPESYTSNWSLFDAVQQLPGKDMTPLEFDLLEDSDLLKSKQKLSYWKSTDVNIGDNVLQLTGYQQMGQGILPYQYWVDGHHRLLFAISGIRAYIFDPNAQKGFEQRIQRLLRRKR
jgi:hypothetical protein